MGSMNRAGRVVAGLLVALCAVATAFLAAGGAVFYQADWGSGSTSPALGTVWWVAAAVVLVGGLWCAWRVSTGHWGLRRRPTEPSPPQA
jgi:TRAP-type C4-dicarboxylate transport system permease small subunit